VFKQQTKLVKLAGEMGAEQSSIKSLQIQLAKNHSFRLLAVHQATTNKGGSTPGIDNVILETKEEKAEMVENLLNLLIKAEKGEFKSSPVKRVMIPKANGKLRPLGIPTIEDRCLQALLKLVLEPIVELNSDPNSYGFRPLRGAKNAVAAIRTTLKSGLESK
jgi:RNA-directed DNA polymerase